MKIFLYSLALLYFLFSSSILAKQKNLYITGMTKKVKGDFELNIVKWGDVDLISKEDKLIKNNDRDSRGHGHQIVVYDDSKIKLISIYGKLVSNNETKGIIPYKLIQIDSNNTQVRVKAYPFNSKVLNKFDAISLKRQKEPSARSISLFINSYKTAIELEVLKSNDNLSWGVPANNFREMIKPILNNLGKKERDIFLLGAKDILGEVNPEVRINSYVTFLTEIHSLKKEFDNGPLDNKIDTWVRKELESIFKKIF